MRRLSVSDVKGPHESPLALAVGSLKTLVGMVTAPQHYPFCTPRTANSEESQSKLKSPKSHFVRFGLPLQIHSGAPCSVGSGYIEETLHTFKAPEGPKPLDSRALNPRGFLQRLKTSLTLTFDSASQPDPKPRDSSRFDGTRAIFTPWATLSSR